MKTKEIHQLLDEVHTIFVTGKGMPTSANDEIIKKLQKAMDATYS
jgi:hypothetical protein